MKSSTRNLKAFCTDCTLPTGRSYIENDRGERQNIDTGIYLHHAIMMNVNKWANCFGMGRMCGAKAPKTPSLVILGLSDSSDTIYTSPDGSFKAGNYLGPNNKTFQLMSDIVNYSVHSRRSYGSPWSMSTCLAKRKGIWTLSYNLCRWTFAVGIRQAMELTVLMQRTNSRST